MVEGGVLTPADGPGFKDDHRASGLWWWERRQANPDGK